MLSVLLSTVAALSQCLAGWTTFHWAYVINKEMETTEVSGKQRSGGNNQIHFQAFPITPSNTGCAHSLVSHYGYGCWSCGIATISSQNLLP